MKTDLLWRWALTIGIILSMSVSASAEAQTATLAPPVKTVHWGQARPSKLKTDSVAIVVGARATAPERSAADMLQRYAARRFNVNWPVLVEDREPPSQATVILLGQRSTHDWLDRLCTERDVDLGPTSPGPDGYVIEMFDSQGRSVILAGGSNDRAVGVCAGHAVSVALTGGRGSRHSAGVDSRLAHRALARPASDAGRPSSPAGIMDCYVSSRVNFIDLRNGIYAFEPDYVFTDEDKGNISRAIESSP